ncbi:MAG: hypothetical protein AAF621_05885 [Pseudomonadota bacterium]
MSPPIDTSRSGRVDDTTGRTRRETSDTGRSAYGTSTDSASYQSGWNNYGPSSYYDTDLEKDHHHSDYTEKEYSDPALDRWTEGGATGSTSDAEVLVVLSDSSISITRGRGRVPADHFSINVGRGEYAVANKDSNVTIADVEKILRNTRLSGYDQDKVLDFLEKLGRPAKWGDVYSILGGDVKEDTLDRPILAPTIAGSYILYGKDPPAGSIYFGDGTYLPPPVDLDANVSKVDFYKILDKYEEYFKEEKGVSAEQFAILRKRLEAEYDKLEEEEAVIDFGDIVELLGGDPDSVMTPAQLKVMSFDGNPVIRGTSPDADDDEVVFFYDSLHHIVIEDDEELTLEGFKDFLEHYKTFLIADADALEDFEELEAGWISAFEKLLEEENETELTFKDVFEIMGGVEGTPLRAEDLRRNILGSIKADTSSLGEDDLAIQLQDGTYLILDEEDELSEHDLNMFFDEYAASLDDTTVPTYEDFETLREQFLAIFHDKKDRSGKIEMEDLFEMMAAPDADDNNILDFTELTTLAELAGLEGVSDTANDSDGHITFAFENDTFFSINLEDTIDSFDDLNAVIDYFIATLDRSDEEELAALNNLQNWRSQWKDTFNEMQKKHGDLQWKDVIEMIGGMPDGRFTFENFADTSQLASAQKDLGIERYSDGSGLDDTKEIFDFGDDLYLNVDMTDTVSEDQFDTLIEYYLLTLDPESDSDIIDDINAWKNGWKDAFDDIKAKGDVTWADVIEIMGGTSGERFDKTDFADNGSITYLSNILDVQRGSASDSSSAFVFDFGNGRYMERSDNDEADIDEFNAFLDMYIASLDPDDSDESEVIDNIKKWRSDWEDIFDEMADDGKLGWDKIQDIIGSDKDDDGVFTYDEFQRNMVGDRLIAEGSPPDDNDIGDDEAIFVLPGDEGYIILDDDVDLTQSNIIGLFDLYESRLSGDALKDFQDKRERWETSENLDLIKGHDGDDSSLSWVDIMVLMGGTVGESFDPTGANVSEDDSSDTGEDSFSVVDGGVYIDEGVPPRDLGDDKIAFTIGDGFYAELSYTIQNASDIVSLDHLESLLDAHNARVRSTSSESYITDEERQKIISEFNYANQQGLGSGEKGEVTWEDVYKILGGETDDNLLDLSDHEITPLNAYSGDAFFAIFDTENNDTWRRDDGMIDRDRIKMHVIGTIPDEVDDLIDDAIDGFDDFPSFSDIKRSDVRKDDFNRLLHAGFDKLNELIESNEDYEKMRDQLYFAYISKMMQAALEEGGEHFNALLNALRHYERNEVQNSTGRGAIPNSSDYRRIVMASIILNEEPSSTNYRFGSGTQYNDMKGWIKEGDLESIMDNMSVSKFWGKDEKNDRMGMFAGYKT